MNRYPWWKYFIMVVVLVVGAIYALPNLYGESPAVQISGIGDSKVDDALLRRGEQILAAAKLQPESAELSGNTLNYRFANTSVQLKARDVLAKALNPDPANPHYVVAVNLLSRSPAWLAALNAHPMYLGLDLRGGVHFLLQVDMQAAVHKKLDSIAGELRRELRDKDVRYTKLERVGDTIEAVFVDAAALDQAKELIARQHPDLQLAPQGPAGPNSLSASLTPAAVKQEEEYAIKQNIQTLHNRINELGVAEPIIQQQGQDRVVVELPGIQDVARAKDILGRTASLEVRMVDDSPAALAALAGQGPLPPGDQIFPERGGGKLAVKRDVLLTGDNLTDAQPGFDQQTGEPAVFLTLDSKGARIFQEVTRDNIGKRTAMILFDRGRGEIVTAPVIRSEIAGGRVQISGNMTVQEANDTALLLRAGALAAPMTIIEERTVGPSLGQQNISQGFHSVTWGFVAIVVFMSIYYMFFGVVSSIALAVNLLLLVAVLSMLQATLTLPGIAAMALALGMAIDANVLINERIREELRNGASPQSAIYHGYERAWATILDSNVTTLIAGVALLIFGSGAVRGFAVVHVLGILTSMFSAVFFSRGLINLWYGRKRRLHRISIGQVWKPEPATAAPAPGASSEAVEPAKPLAVPKPRSTKPRRGRLH
jgi:preprotein translocase subunit SecD